MDLTIDVVIKFGGSAITEKNEFETANIDKIYRAASLIKECVGARLTCVVVHGAGSFGHHQAKEYNVNKGFTKNTLTMEPDRVKEGFCKTRQSVVKLNQLVTGALLDAGVHAVSQSPSGRWVTRAGVVIQDDIRALTSLVQAGFVPVIHGDCVLDEEQGCTILSGDTIIKVICQRCRCRRVVFLTDVEGIYDKPPNTDGATLIPEIIIRDGEVSTSIETSSNKHDVTGGVLLKLQTAIDIVKTTNGVTPVFICQVASESAAHVCLHGKLDNFPGTRINKLTTG